MLRHVREIRDRNKMREKFWNLAGSKMGNLLKVKKDPEDSKGDPLSEKADEVDYKAQNKYAESMKQGKQTGASTFALTKTIKQ